MTDFVSFLPVHSHSTRSTLDVSLLFADFADLFGTGTPERADLCDGEVHKMQKLLSDTCHWAEGDKRKFCLGGGSIHMQ